MKDKKYPLCFVFPNGNKTRVHIDGRSLKKLNKSIDEPITQKAMSLDEFYKIFQEKT